MSDASGKCGCGKASKSCDTKSAAIQNGKGDAPRNISESFRSNYEGIRWSGSKSSKSGKGEKFVKVYA